MILLSVKSNAEIGRHAHNCTANRPKTIFLAKVVNICRPTKVGAKTDWLSVGRRFVPLRKK